MKKYIIPCMAILIIVLGIALGTKFEIQSTYNFKPGDVIWEPEYGSIECEFMERAETTFTAYPGDIIYCPPIYKSGNYTMARSVKSCDVSILFHLDWIGADKVVIEKWNENGLVKRVVIDLELYNPKFETYQEIPGLGAIKGNFYSGTIKSKEWIKIKEAYDCSFGTIDCREIPISVKMKYDVYTIEVEEKGKKYTLPVEQGCTLRKDAMIEDDYREKLVEEEDVYVLPPGNEINYVVRWSPSSAEYGVYDYKGMKVVCTSNYAYPIERFQFLDGTWGWKVSGSGFPVECCPHPDNPYCKIENGEFVRRWSPPKEGDKCSIWSISSYDWIPIEGGKVAKFECRDGVWVKIEEKENECLKGCGVNEICEDFECKKLGEYRDFIVEGKGRPIDTIAQSIDMADMILGGLVSILAIVLGILIIALFLIFIILLIRR